MTSAGQLKKITYTRDDLDPCPRHTIACTAAGIQSLRATLEWWQADAPAVHHCLTGGRNCSKENPAKQKGRNAISGLHSSWVGDKVLAMARPWQQHVVRHNLPAAFADNNIGMILNLQEVSSTRLQMQMRMRMRMQYGMCNLWHMLPVLWHARHSLHRPDHTISNSTCNCTRRASQQAGLEATRSMP